MPGRHATAVWRLLDERERAYLIAAYALEQEQGPPTPPGHWLPAAADAPLHARLAARGLADAAIAAAFAALEHRRLLATRREETAPGGVLLVRLTVLGRAVARAGAG